VFLLIAREFQQRYFTGQGKGDLNTWAEFSADANLVSASVVQVKRAGSKLRVEAVKGVKPVAPSECEVLIVCIALADLAN
jgi:hypothetical protein